MKRWPPKVMKLWTRTLRYDQYEISNVFAIDKLKRGFMVNEAGSTKELY